MKYDFDELIPRRGTNSCKWDSAPDDDIIPLWVADMDFRTAPAVIEALQKRVSHGIFGYTRVPDEYYDAVSGWFSRRHGLAIGKEDIITILPDIELDVVIIHIKIRSCDLKILSDIVYRDLFRKPFRIFINESTHIKHTHISIKVTQSLYT